VLGNDSADAIAGSMRANLAEFEAWEHIARSTDFDALDDGPDRRA
jgi:hypothetical protein